MIVPRAIAQDGYGYGALSIAASGYLAGAAAPQPQPGGSAGFRARKARGEQADDWIAGEALGEALCTGRAALLAATAGLAAGEAETFGRLHQLSLAVGRTFGAAEARAADGARFRFQAARDEDEAWLLHPKGDA